MTLNGRRDVLAIALAVLVVAAVLVISTGTKGSVEEGAPTTTAASTVATVPEATTEPAEGPGTEPPAPSSTTTPSLTIDDSSTTTEAPDAPSTTLPTLDVSTVSFPWVDTTRSTQAHGGFPVTPQRKLPTTIWYPTTGGPYPLVVFGAGYANAAGDYHDLLHEVASHGFVVAAPDFPLTSPVNTGAMVEADLTNEPPDLSFVAGQVQTTPALAGKVATGRFATMGHSDGATVALAAAYDACCVDHRIGAVVSLSGNTSGFHPASFTGAPPTLLAVHGDADTTNPYGNSVAMFNRAQSPKFLLTVLGGTHESPFIRDASRPQIAAVVADFLRGALGGSRSATARMATDGDVDGVLSLQSG